MQEASNQMISPYLKRLVAERVLPDRFINYYPNNKLSKVIGFIGPRGSMKSLSASAMTIIDYLIPGYNVWSNMNIGWGLDYLGEKLIYQTQDLNKKKMMNFNLENGLVFVDEINLEFSEARRSMTNKNLTFNKLIQQIRKKQINMIYTVQSELWIDNRLRWQTDIFIKCQDSRMRPGGNRLPHLWGEVGYWSIYDMSGILGAGSYFQTQRPVKTLKFYGKQWWNTYNTFETQAEDDEDYNSPDYEEPQFSKQEMELLKAIDEVVMGYVEARAAEASQDELLDQIAEKVTFNIFNSETEKEIQKALLQATGYSTCKFSGNRKIHRFNRLLKQTGELVTV